MVEGKKACKRQGILYCADQIKKGLVWVKRALGQDLHVELPFGYESFDDDLNNEQELKGNEILNKDYCDSDNDDFESYLGTPVSVLDDGKEILSQEGFSILEEVQAMEGIFLYDYPLQLCQSMLEGRDGSNACSLICLILGYTILVKLTDLGHNFCMRHVEYAEVLCGSIHHGNTIYDNCRAELPARYLTVTEAILLVDSIDLELVEEHNVFHHSESSSETLASRLIEIANGYEGRKVMVLYVIDYRCTVFIFSTNGSITFFDTHCHFPNGARICWTASKNNIPRLLSGLFPTCTDAFGYIALFLVD